jgi:hypothetical protein
MNAGTIMFVNRMLKAFDDAGSSFVATLTETPTENNSLAPGVSLMAQAIVAFGNGAFESVEGYDVFWHTAVFRNDREYHADEEAKILNAYREWQGKAKRLIDLVASLESQAQPIPGLDLLRLNVRKAESILTDDGDFFEGEALDNLAEQAIAAFERGETEEFTEIGQ